MLVLREEDGELPARDAVRLRVAAFEPGEKGYEKLPLHTAHEDENGEYADDGDYSEGTVEQLDIDEEFDHTEHTATSACVTTENDCFDEQFDMGTSMVKTYMRVQLRAAGAFRHVPVAFFQLEDDFVLPRPVVVDGDDTRN